MIMKLKFYFGIILISFLSCVKENKFSKDEKSISCVECFKRELVFEKLNYYTTNKFICNQYGTKNFDEKRKKKVYGYFSDKNFDFYGYEDNTRIIFDKKMKIWMAISSNGYSGFEYNNMKNRYISFYFLDENLTPLCHINQAFDVSIFIDDKKNKKLREFVVNIDDLEKIKLESVSYEQILLLHSKLIKKEYKIVKEKTNTDLDEFYKDQPLWTIFYH